MKNQCLAELKDGSRCGRFAKPNETFCSVHSPNYVPKGAAVRRPRPVTHRERLERFANSADRDLALKATLALARLDTENGVIDDGRFTLASSEDYHTFRQMLTCAELSELLTLVKSHKELRERLLAKYADVPAVRRVLKGQP